MFFRNSLLSTYNCKISDFSEGNNFRGVKIQFFPWSSVKFMLYFANKIVRQDGEVCSLRYMIAL